MSDTRIPGRIDRLPELAQNLWWSWHPSGVKVFRRLDYLLWRYCNHNPVLLLSLVSQATLDDAAADQEFLAMYDDAITLFDGYIGKEESWYTRNSADQLGGPVAYFSMEFAIHNSLPIYAGGLGVLAGDLCKEASDLGIPMIAVGFMYPQGYFHQRISAEGWQEEEYRELDFSQAPITPIRNDNGERRLTEVILKNRKLHIGAWLVKVGNVQIYLLDTALKENTPEDQNLSNRLYTADLEHRLQQEILLGIGGTRILRNLDIHPSVWHANEGHTSFMMLERILEHVREGMSYHDALEKVRSKTVFTTHTPVPAGHDIFDTRLITSYFRHYWPALGLSRDMFLDLGRPPGSHEPFFNMTTLGLQTAGYRNAVSNLHGKVTRRMWHSLWPEKQEDEVPISSITNGIHIPTWIAPDMDLLYRDYLGKDWITRRDDPATWKHIDDIPDEELWNVHQSLKRALFHIILERAQARWANAEASPQQILAMGALLDHDTLTIAFSRRFAEYKRPALIFHDLERLKKLVNDDLRPIQIVFAGKSHPADTASKILLQQVHTIARDRNFQGRIAFLEDYDIHLAKYLVRGIDVWLNVPRRLREASGTSGMKACLNGVLHMSVPDGWWYEGYNGTNGWVIGSEEPFESPEEEDNADADALYGLLEQQVIPLFYDRGRDNVPAGWTQMMKQSIKTNGPLFSARRMVSQYHECMYLPAARS